MPNRIPDERDETSERTDMFNPAFKRTHATEQVLDRICDSNMRLAKVLSPCIIVAVLGIVFASQQLLGELSPTRTQSVLFAVVTIAMIATCIMLSVGAHRYSQGKLTSRRQAYVYLTVFVVMGYVYSIVVSCASYYAVNRMSLFYISMIINAVLLVFIPPIQTLTSLAAVIAFLTTFSLLGMDTLPLTASCLTFLIAIVVAGIMRYREQKRGVKATLEAENESQTDQLTGLSNRLAFDMDLPSYVDKNVAIGMTDVDDFKYFNDAYSHEMGDRVLRGFAQALIDSFPNGTPYRYGGDEFVVLAEITDSTDVETRTQTFLTEVSNISLGLDESEKVSASMGYAQGRPHDMNELRNLLHMADRKLYEAKRNGKGQVSGISLDDAAIMQDSLPTSGLPFLRSYELDGLTNLPNMQYFRAHALQAAAHLNDQGRDAVLMHLNLVNFKLINERQGYKAGDQLLQTTANAIHAAFPGMLCARIAEDRFALICAEADIEQGLMQVQQVVDTHKHEPSTTLKVGVYQIRGPLTDIGNAYDAAKTACDSIKQVHGQSLRYYDEELQQTVERRRYVFDHIGEAIRDNHLVVYYQPVFRSITGKLCGCEALVRWKDERYGMIPPFEFISLLEDAQQISELDRYVVTRVCDDWKAIHEAGESAQPVSVNFSRIDFQLTDVVQLVEENTQRVGMPRKMLHVEVTESAFTDADNRLKDQIGRLRQLGYQVWMDDFGSGYSSLNQLEWHDFDVAKIDMAFLRNFGNPQVRSMLTSIVDMIKRLGVQTLVEGVETKEQFEFMRAIGCEFIQGYYLGKPMELSAFRALLEGPADTVEPFTHRGYYDAIGRVNPLSQDPFDFNGRHSLRKANQQGLALATAEWTPGKMRFLSTNASFRELVTYLGFDLPIGADGIVGAFTVPVAGLERIMRATCDTDEEITSDFTIQGENCVMHSRKIASYRGTHAVLLTLEDSSRVPGHTLRTQFDVAIRYVYSLYDIIDLIDRTSGIISNIYSEAASLLDPTKPEMLLSQASVQYANEYIHPDDRDRYLDYIDMGTLDERVARADRPYLTGAFRALSPSGSYRWTVTVLIPMETKDGRFLVLCRRNADFGLVKQYQAKNAMLGDDLLWDAAMRLLPEKVFWKDRERRFLGANKPFLDYYGFESQRDILGKTDEDMGWNLDANSFMRDEKQVVDHGETLMNEPGTTIAKGKPRRIVSCKAPLKRNGEIKGLVGFFTDVEEQMGARDSIIALTSIDAMTGLLNSIGIRDTLSQFESTLAEKGPDYGLVYLDIDNLRDINREHGYAFGNRVLARIGAVLTQAIGTRGIVGRMYTDEFVITRQFDEEDDVQKKRELDELAVLARDAIAGIETVDAVPCSTDASYGYALRSETEGTTTLLTLAESRMRDERHLRAASSRGKFPPLSMTVSDVKRYMEILKGNYDQVRLVDPSTCQARELAKRQRFGEPFRCYTTFGRHSRCINCICARTLADRQGHEKHEATSDTSVLMHSQYVSVDGAPYVLEMITDLTQEEPASAAATETSPQLPMEPAKSSAAEPGASKNPAPFTAEKHDSGNNRFDAETGAFSARYLKDTLLNLRSQAVAVIGVDAPEEQLNEAMRTAVQIVGEHVRPTDAIVRLNDRLIVIVFDGDMPQTQLEPRMQNIRQQLKDVAIGDEKDRGIPAIIGAISRQGQVSELLREAERNAYRAKAGNGVYVSGE